MNTERIRQACNDIETNTAALAWLEEHGRAIIEYNERVRFEVTFPRANSVNGSSLASTVVEKFAALAFADILETSIRNCRNTIQMARDAIAEELAK